MGQQVGHVCTSFEKIDPASQKEYYSLMETDWGLMLMEL